MALNTKPNDLAGYVILQACSSGKYSGSEAQVLLNKIASCAHSAILDLCKQYSERALLFQFYDSFDKSCYNIVHGKYWTSQDVGLISKIELAPAVFSYLLNAVLCSKSESLKRPDNIELNPIVELAFAVIQMCNYSNFLYHTGGNDGFEITETGELHFIQSERSKILQKRVMQKVRQRRLTAQSKVHRNELWGEIPSWEDISRPYDPVFKHKYGIKLLEICKIISYGIQHNIRKQVGAISSSYRELIKTFRKGVNLSRATVERAMLFFELEREMLQNEWRFYKIYDMRPSSSRQPIIHISGKIGKDGTIVFGPNALVRALSLLLADINRGIVDFGEFSQRHLREKGVLFEKQVRDLFDKYGFNVLHIKDVPSNVGDIDCVAYTATQGTLFVIEAKSPKIDLNPKKAGWQTKKTQEWCLQLAKKSAWVKANLERVAEMLKIHMDDIKEIKSIVVVEVPTFCDLECASKIVTIEDLYYMLEAMRTN